MNRCDSATRLASAPAHGDMDRCRHPAARPQRENAEAQNPHAAIAHGHAWARGLVRALGIELVVHGTPPDGPHLLLANHRSYVDIVAILSQVPCAFLAKAEVESWPLFGACGAADAHRVRAARRPVEPQARARRRARAAAARRVVRGVPGGHDLPRSRASCPFYPGLFRLAEQYDFPVVPIAIEYEDSDDAWVGDGSFIAHFLTAFRKRRMCVRLVFGKPLRAREVEDVLGATRAFIQARVRPETR